MIQGNRFLSNYWYLLFGLVVCLLLFPKIANALGSPEINGDLVFQCENGICEEGFIVEIYPHIKYFVEANPIELDSLTTLLAEEHSVFNKSDGVYKIIDWIAGPNCRPEYVEYCEIIQVELVDKPYELLFMEAKKEVESLYRGMQLRYGFATIISLVAFVIFPIYLVIKRKRILYLFFLFLVWFGMLIGFPPYWLLSSENIFWFKAWANLSCIFPLIIFICILRMLHLRWQKNNMELEDV